ncbi:hypothetical protein KXD93_25875 [Mucilaginibacter sp. BJC16-A38]|uniref:hypothetical protein n=1 Tax=Mucilaginibacter phenanthrenivorans TaxID=1234842 RepID=UPI002156FE3D|nr:hypothetical protein [Mucilaginibacter phenanthrenivorans]MCR8561113.1 hypothetical protein [Mucilaginibacter phenanthrenivorans]
MKNTIIIAALACSICILSACGGDRVPRSGTGDTVKSTYGNTPDSSKLDTGKTTGMDNSGSGGTKSDSVKKDTAKK